jgi:DNA-directed RNA polymerase subunit RPC12/RpoP
VTRFKCPSCSFEIEADEADAGATGQCPGCGRPVTVPRSGPRLRPAAPLPPVLQPHPELKPRGHYVASLAVVAAWIGLTAVMIQYDSSMWFPGSYLVCVIASAAIGAHKRRLVFGLLLGLFLYAIGIVIIALSPPAVENRSIW